MSLEYMVTVETLITCERFPITVTKSYRVIATVVLN